MTLRVFAPAKINLCLHVTGRRADGYHLLDSLVVFADVGDTLELQHGALDLTVRGPEAVHLDGDNLILQAARYVGLDARMHLTKNLPVASGIGGGSADAAAALRGLASLHGTDLPISTEALGADVPMCVASSPLRATGVGEDLHPLPALPSLWMVLANPRVGVSTPAVFKARPNVDGSSIDAPVEWATAADFATYLQAQRNDLEPTARALCPQIDDVLTALSSQDPLLARMSGSGATCFGLFADANSATAAADALRRDHPDWWVADCAVLGPEPQLIRATT